MRLHESFEWDQDKALANLQKHGVTFDQAAEVLSDEDGDQFHLEENDNFQVEEDRYITTASHPANRNILLVICWTQRETEAGLLTRIISARRATKAERSRYETEIF